ncbi:ABC transporter ATP-binding protein [Aneurinibacillus sp. Ricciae_BoGa-3]|uniref:ABC transporter ATP-binding protein n=1 Tax=Aneurinibacillus sp. Ricciae_BoGa-3 TaxID=3022697 RepID=UPI00234036D6|nr:ABC transporter ATP-binding protein [Aneurinibacillus sp. Ricciae_BoGa-3]WCK52947.1 ABC transporter ATP-binding protein [Aneurinibacillus sp. Ricciae_BoGa-3]
MSNLQIINIEKHYGKTKGDALPLFSLKPVRLTVKEGEFFALLGPSGCGKTTLLKVIAGLLPPEKGEILFGSQTITSLPAEKRGFGMIFQQSLLFPHMSVEDNVAFGLKMQGINRRERLPQARKMLSAVGLEGYGSRHPMELSGGQQQRVSLARAIVSKPKLLLMDEPFSALDPSLRDEMRELVKRIHQQYKITILFVTHDREEAFLLADRMAVMKNGSILQVGTPQEIYEDPNDIEVALFMGAKNIIEGELNKGYFSALGFHVKLYKEDTIEKKQGWLVLRPESLYAVTRDALSYKEDKFSDTNVRTLQGTLTEMSFRQGFYHMKVKVGSTIIDVLEKPGGASLSNHGDAITILFDIRQARFIPQYR